MSLRSDPNPVPERPDPVTRNQPEMEKINTDERTGTECIPGNYPTDSNDSTSSGGYGSSPDKTWSNRAQRGIDMPLRESDVAKNGPAQGNNIPDGGLIDQSYDGTDLTEEIQDAKQGRDDNAFPSEDEWGIEKGAEKDF